MKFETKRKIDELGRIVLPIDMRNYYEIANGDRVVLLPVREGIQIAKADLFILNKLPREVVVTVDVLGRIVIPSAIRKQFGFEPKDTMCILPNETCMLMYKEKALKEA